MSTEFVSDTDSAAFGEGGYWNIWPGQPLTDAPSGLTLQRLPYSERPHHPLFPRATRRRMRPGNGGWR